MVDKCNDSKCCGDIATRGHTFIGKVVSDKMHKTVVVRWEYNRYDQKYQRYAKHSTRKSAHNPDCIGAKVGDVVEIAECRPLSKTKTFVVTKVIR